MKFVSKNPNLRIVLSPGIPGEKLTGRLPISMKSIKFIDGLAEVRDEEWIKMALGHPGFNHDFFELPEDKKDPYASIRRSTEPEHDVMEIEYGHPGKQLNPRSPVPMSPEQKRVLTDMATAMTKEALKELVPEMAKNMLKELIASQKKNDVLTEKTDFPSIPSVPSFTASSLDSVSEETSPMVVDPETGEEKGKLVKKDLPPTGEVEINTIPPKQSRKKK